MIKLLPYLLIISLIIYISNLAQKTTYAPDDTFIYMQYAKNIASGNGFSFNAGEPGYGVTSPLWVLLLTVPYFINIDAFWFAKIIDLIFYFMSIFAMFKLADNYFKGDKNLIYLACSVFMLNSWLVRWSFTGMETSLAVCLVIYSFYLYYSENYYLLFFVNGALQLIRPESFLLTIIFYLFIVINKIHSKKFRITEPVLFILCYAVLIVPFNLYALYNFGTILPNTVLGKSTFSFSLQTIASQLIQIFRTLSASSIIEIILSVYYVFVFFRKDNKDKNAIPLIWICGLILLYVVTDADIISRYFLIISPFFILIGFSIFGKIKNFRISQLLIVYLIFAVFSQFVFYVYVKQPINNFSRGVAECLIPIGKWLNENTPSGSKILVNDVGAIGYYSDRYIIDAAALINSDIELNKKIMSTPLEKRMATHKLLDIVKADYVIERDTSSANNLKSYQNINLTFLYMREFQGLGIKDDATKYYKVYKVEYK